MLRILLIILTSPDSKLFIKALIVSIVLGHFRSLATQAGSIVIIIEHLGVRCY